MQLAKSNNASEQVTALQTSGFLVVKTSKGGTDSLKPISRVEFRKKHNLKNGEAKKQYATYMRDFTAAASADFAYHAQSMGCTGLSVTKGGARKYTLREQTDVVVSGPREITREMALKALGVDESQLAAVLALAPAK